MSQTEKRLIQCFGAVFPWLTPEQIRNARADSSEIWDSMSTVTLVAVVQEEFGLEIPLDVVPQLDSFGAFQTYLDQLDVGAWRNPS